eukprot:TRINITY_DN614_c0_g1_i1.p1 TRINITY_DN614_c0_g1~~TRINITY_DN614_c0_g1_i1.p1  ORF type:complete len:312 (+),score=82.56 TRINITY_DN614_c0_g1_i1:112-1047(+)
MFAYQGIYARKQPRQRQRRSMVSGWNPSLLDSAPPAEPPVQRTMSAMSRCSFADFSVVSSTVAAFARERLPSMLKEEGAYLLPRLPAHVAKDHLTIILDLDETLAYRRGGPLVMRPYLTEFLQLLATVDCEVVVWTAGMRSYAQQIIAQIDPHGVITHCVYRHAKWYPSGKGRGVDAADERCSGNVITKNLALTGRCPNYTLIVDNTPDCVMHNALNGIVVNDFTPDCAHDTTLLALMDIISELRGSGKTVPAFIRSCSELRLLTVCDNHSTGYMCYFLDESRWGGPSVECAKTQGKLKPCRAEPLQNHQS